MTLPGFPVWQGGWSKGRPFFLGGEVTPRPGWRPGLARRAGAGLAVMAALASGPGALPAAWAQGGDARPVYRCPGPPVLYTDALTPEAARARQCQVLETPALTVGVGAPRPAGAAPAAPPAPTASPAAPRGETRVDPAVQRSRDAQARRILEAELRREEARLEALRREFAGGEPERRGDERNYARYLERVEALRAAIARTEADVAAIRRELARLAP